MNTSPSQERWLARLPVQYDFDSKTEINSSQTTN